MVVDSLHSNLDHHHSTVTIADLHRHTFPAIRIVVMDAPMLTELAGSSQVTRLPLDSVNFPFLS